MYHVEYYTQFEFKIIEDNISVCLLLYTFDQDQYLVAQKLIFNFHFNKSTSLNEYSIISHNIIP